jgi:hypothetical protein
MAKAFPLLTVDPNGTLQDNAPLMLHIRLGELLGFARHIADVERVTELHNMRIAAKRLRYTLELFLPYAVGPTAKQISGLIDKTKKIQDMIGDIHDRDVRVPLLADFLQRHEDDHPEIRIGLERLIDRELSERERLYGTLMEYWNAQRGKYVARLYMVIASIAQDAPAADEEPKGDEEA